MKKHSYLIVTMLMSLILFLVISNLEKSIAEGENLTTTISIFGYVIDEENNPVENVKVITEDSLGNKIESRTNSRGYYSIKGLEKNEQYNIYYDYSEKDYITVKSIEGRQFEKYDNKLEVAYIYNPTNYESAEIGRNTMEDFTDQLEIIKSNTGQDASRYIYLEYGNEEQLKERMDKLTASRTSDDSLWKYDIKNWKSTYVIDASNELVDNIINSNSFDAGYKQNLENCIKQIQENSTENRVTFLSKIYENLKLTQSNQREMNHTSDTEKIEKITSLSINYDTMLNMVLGSQQSGSSGGAGEYNENAPLQGQITAEDNDGNYKPVTECMVYLRKVSTNERIGPAKPNAEGKFCFEGLVNGQMYVLEYYFYEPDHGDVPGVNGQNYNIVDECVSVQNSTSIEQNTARFMARTEVSEGVGVNPNLFTNQMEWRLDNEPYVEGQTDRTKRAMYAISGPDEDVAFVYRGNTLYGGVRLEKRQEFSLEVISEITAYRIVLRNGQIFNEWKRQDGEKMPSAISVTMDDKIRYGSTLYIEYNIIVENKSNIDCTGFSIITGNNFEFNPELDLLTTDNGAKSSEQWQKLTDLELEQYIGLKGDLEKEEYLKIDNFSSDGSTVLSAGDKCEYKLVFSKIIAESCIFDNVTEIVKYRDNGYNDEGGRRNYSYSENHITGTKSVAGNYWLGEDNNFFEGIEKDTGISEALMIMPMTGRKKTNIITVVTLMLIIFIIIYIKKRKLGGR